MQLSKGTFCSIIHQNLYRGYYYILTASPRLQFHKKNPFYPIHYEKREKKLVVPTVQFVP